MNLCAVKLHAFPAIPSSSDRVEVPDAAPADEEVCCPRCLHSGRELVKAWASCRKLLPWPWAKNDNRRAIGWPAVMDVVVLPRVVHRVVHGLTEVVKNSCIVKPFACIEHSLGPKAGPWLLQWERLY